jgi:galactokinase
MGGGFGGCTITLVEKKEADEFMWNIRTKYESGFGKLPDCYTMNISDGAHMVN